MRRRRRNSCLAAIEHMRRQHGDVRLTDAITFLYVCENEGINVRELAQLAGLTPSSASRTARRLAAREAPRALAPWLGLIELDQQATDARGRSLTLTSKGRQLRHEIDSLIKMAIPIIEIPKEGARR
jgi:DNA-binding MarR family transcriptional regulator